MFAGYVTPITPKQLLLQIDDENMIDINTYFGGNQLVLEEDFTLEDDDADELGLARGFTIAEGTYPMTLNDVDKHYEVELKSSK